MKHKKYCLVWDNGHDTSGVEFDTYEEAKETMQNMYIGWSEAETDDWDWGSKFPDPTPEQIESWDQMIDECYCYIVEWNDELGEYNDSYYGEGLTDEELKEIGWDYWANVRRDWNESHKV